MPGVDFHAIRSMVSIRQILELLGFVPTTTRCDHVYGICPIHGPVVPARRDSFSANLAKNNYRCFECGSQGPGAPGDLWAAATSRNLFDAAVDLCAKLPVAVPWRHRL